MDECIRDLEYVEIEIDDDVRIEVLKILKKEAKYWLIDYKNTRKNMNIISFSNMNYSMIMTDYELQLYRKCMKKKTKYYRSRYDYETVHEYNIGANEDNDRDR